MLCYHADSDCSQSRAFNWATPQSEWGCWRTAVTLGLTSELSTNPAGRDSIASDKYIDLGSVPTPCGNPLFLVRLPAHNRWIATGAVRVIGDEDAQ